MAYYYFNFRDVKKLDRYGPLSSFVSQLSAELDSCHNVLSWLYSDHAGGTRKPTTDALTKCLKDSDMLDLPGVHQENPHLLTRGWRELATLNYCSLANEGFPDATMTDLYHCRHCR